MNRSKYFIAAGTLALAIGTFFAGNATKRLFTAVQTLYYKHGSSCTTINSASIFTTTAVTPITFRTAAGNAVTVHSASPCTAGNQVSVSLIP